MVNSLTLKDVQDMSLQLVNQYSMGGILMPNNYNNQQDYLLRIPLLINAAQNYIATTTRKIFAEFTFTQNPIMNELGGDTHQIKQHLEGDLVFTAPKAKAYYFEVDADADVRIESGGVVTKTVIANHRDAGFQAFRGFTQSTGDTSIIFSGMYPYNVRNVALYNVNFPQETDIPAHTFYNEYEMPDDFYQLSGRGIPHNTSSGFKMSHDYKWRGRKTLLIPSSAIGEWKVDYYRYPFQVTMETPLETVLDNSIEAQLCIPYYVAAHLTFQDDPERSRQLNNEFEVRLTRIQDDVQSEVSPVEDVYFGGVGY